MSSFSKTWLSPLPLPIMAGVMAAWMPLSLPVMCGLVCGIGVYAVLLTVVASEEPAEQTVRINHY